MIFAYFSMTYADLSSHMLKIKWIEACFYNQELWLKNGTFFVSRYGPNFMGHLKDVGKWGLQTGEFRGTYPGTSHVALSNREGYTTGQIWLEPWQSTMRWYEVPNFESYLLHPVTVCMGWSLSCHFCFRFETYPWIHGPKPATTSKRIVYPRWPQSSMELSRILLHGDSIPPILWPFE